MSRGKQLVEMALQRRAERQKADCNNNEILYSDYSSSEHDDDVRDPDFVPKKKKRKIAKRVDEIIHTVRRNAKAENAGLKHLPLSNRMMCNETSSDSSFGYEESDIDYETLSNKVMNPNERLDTRENIESETQAQTEQIRW